MMRRLLFLLVVLMSARAMAQQRSITGTITDPDSGEALPGATVLVKGSTNGTITNLEGNYEIVAQDTDVLVISFIGYQTQEILVGTQSRIDAELQLDYQSLDEVVVVGYGEMKRSDLTGAVVSVQSKALAETMAPSFDQALQGRAAGVQVQTTSGQPGGGVSVSIRGISSINLTNEPLYVIDGVQISGNGRYGNVGFSWSGGGDGQRVVNTLSGINMNDIESIEVLKDASATAIYGASGANGVVLITTKSGKKGELKVDYSGYYGIQTIPKKVDVLNLRQFAELRKEFSDEYPNQIGETPAQFRRPDLITDAGTDWQDEVFSPAPMQDHNLGISGGTEKSRYKVSIGYMDQDGIIVGSGFRRLSARLNLDSKVKSWLNFRGSVSVGDTDERITLNDDDRGTVSLTMLQAPDVPVRDDAGNWAGPDDTSLNSLNNPVAMATIRDLTVDRTRIITSGQVDIMPFEGLTISSKLGMDYNASINRAFNPTYEIGRNQNTINAANRNYNNSRFWVWSNYMTYSKDFGTVLNANLMIGNELQESNWDGISGNRTGFVSNDIQELNAGVPSTATNSGWRGSSSLLSYFTRANFSVMDRYLLTLTARADASSKFGPNNKWGYFPSMAVKWKVGNEEFMKSVGAVENLSLRIGYGEIGNQGIDNNLYDANLRTVEVAGGVGYLPDNFPNPDLKWESSVSYNAGLDFTMFNNRIEFIADVYLKRTEDLLMRKPVPCYVGTCSQGRVNSPFVNFGTLENKGVELTLNTVNTTGAVEWTTNATFTLNRNKVLELPSEDAVIVGTVQFGDAVTRTEVGQPIGQFYGYVADGVFTDAEDIRNHAEQLSDGEGGNRIDKRSGLWPGDVKFRDLDGNNIIDEQDRTYIGSPHPDFTFGLNNTVNYKNFDLTVFITGSVGGEVYNYIRTNTESMRVGRNQLATVLDRANVELKEGLNPDDINVTSDPDSYYVTNPDTSIPRVLFSDVNGNARSSTRFVEDGTFVRIRTLSLGYTLPENLQKAAGFTAARVYIRAQNLLTFSKYLGFDPEIGPLNQDYRTAGIDNGNYPQAKTYVLGVNLSF